jgi:hypothetical protein
MRIQRHPSNLSQFRNHPEWVWHGLGHGQSLLRLVELAGRLDYAAGSHLARFGQGSPGFARCRRHLMMEITVQFVALLQPEHS